MKLVIVVIYVKIENFKSINIHVFILSQHLEKVGDYLQDKKYIEEISLCSTSVKYFQQTVKKEKLE
jgi:hypothetical protein